jgi:two-component system LytT family response regulator
MNDARVLIADDEPLARRTLREHLSGVDWIAHIDEAGDGLAAIRAVDALHPDLLFLDIRMPGASGIAVAEQIAGLCHPDPERSEGEGTGGLGGTTSAPPGLPGSISFAALRVGMTKPPYIIFTTAYDRYAVTAFEIGALDYLLKPFGRDRVRAVLERARVAMEHGMPAVAARAEVLPPSKPLAHVFIKERGRIIAIPLERVERIEACDDYVAVCIDGKRHLLHARLQDLCMRLDPARFIRVHRSHVVNISFVKSIEPRDGSRLMVVLASGARIPASRSAVKLMKYEGRISRLVRYRKVQ